MVSPQERSAEVTAAFNYMKDALGKQSFWGKSALAWMGGEQVLMTYIPGLIAAIDRAREGVKK